MQPIQLAIRLLIPCSRLLQLRKYRDHRPIRSDVAQLSVETLGPAGRFLAARTERTIQFSVKLEYDRSTIFEYAWHLLQQAKGSDDEVLPTLPALAARATIPYLTEPWYC